MTAADRPRVCTYCWFEYCERCTGRAAKSDEPCPCAHDTPEDDPS